MGCVSSTLLSQEEEFSQIGGSTAFSHHIVSLTSSTYGLLTLDPPPTTTVAPTPSPPPRITLASLFPSPLRDVPNFRISGSKLAAKSSGNEENACPNLIDPQPPKGLDRYEMICPPNGEKKVVIYTTTLRGVRKTFDECNAVRAALEGLRVSVCERDISMDRGFREELRELMSGKEREEMIPPRVFVKGRYIGGAEEVMRVLEEGLLEDLLQGMDRVREGYVCEGCGGGRFLPCFSCNGSCKVAVHGGEEAVIARCSDCNENGLVHCPVCT